MGTENTGLQGWKILEGIFTADETLTGFKRPNIVNCSPQDLVAESATITYNYPDDVAPTGGVDGDIWYNPVADQEYKRLSGTWTLLTDRVANPDYVAPITNHTDCPLPS